MAAPATGLNRKIRLFFCWIGLHTDVWLVAHTREEIELACKTGRWPSQDLELECLICWHRKLFKRMA